MDIFIIQSRFTVKLKKITGDRNMKFGVQIIVDLWDLLFRSHQLEIW